MVCLAIFKKGARPNVHPREGLTHKKAVRASVFPALFLNISGKINYTLFPNH